MHMGYWTCGTFIVLLGLVSPEQLDYLASDIYFT